MITLPEIKRALIAGDTHGSPKHIEYLYTIAVSYDVDIVLHMGDYGYWEHMKGGPEFLEYTSAKATQTGIPFAFIDGNHENHELLVEYVKDPEEDTWWSIRDNLYYIPRGATWEWQGVKFMGFGGAYSIDERQRVKYVSWWPNEEADEVQIERAVERAEALGGVDVMFTHDVPQELDIQKIFALQGRGLLTSIPGCERSRDKISKVFQACDPSHLFHGHYHLGYRTSFTFNDHKVTAVGLAHENANPLSKSWTVVEIADLK